MSVARDMRVYIMQKKTLTRSKSGGKAPTWKNVCEIKVAVYENSEFVVSASERYKESTHTGLTYCKEIKAGKHRIIRGGKVYQIISADTKHRLTNLILKVVDEDV